MEEGVRRTRLARLLTMVAQMTREELLLRLPGPLWLSLMIWNEAAKKLQVVSGVKINKDEAAQEWDLRLDLDYGEGIAGRVFKTNDTRLYVNPFDPRSREARPTNRQRVNLLMPFCFRSP